MAPPMRPDVVRRVACAWTSLTQAKITGASTRPSSRSPHNAPTTTVNIAHTIGVRLGHTRQAAPAEQRRSRGR
ncbi:hypothetical protein JG687_00015477 [Phytophthora cactorum]|uniref:Uncharacterized protein n=1 Tax=Phytophthora cactorum TaxID=29920 RepID=A0A8T1TW56_9STRA|nr:hypothetical protein JG687_00015477 [Phytophthora cactorum]